MEKPYAIICRGVTLKDGKKHRGSWILGQRFETLQQLLDAWEHGYINRNMKKSNRDNTPYLQYKAVNLNEFKGDLFLYHTPIDVIKKRIRLREGVCMSEKLFRKKALAYADSLLEKFGFQLLDKIEYMDEANPFLIYEQVKKSNNTP